MAATMRHTTATFLLLALLALAASQARADNTTVATTTAAAAPATTPVPVPDTPAPTPPPTPGEPTLQTQPCPSVAGSLACRDESRELCNVSARRPNHFGDSHASEHKTQKYTLTTPLTFAPSGTAPTPSSTPSATPATTTTTPAPTNSTVVVMEVKLLNDGTSRITNVGAYFAPAASMIYWIDGFPGVKVATSDTPPPSLLLKASPLNLASAKSKRL